MFAKIIIHASAFDCQAVTMPEPLIVYTSEKAPAARCAVEGAEAVEKSAGNKTFCRAHTGTEGDVLARRIRVAGSRERSGTV